MQSGQPKVWNPFPGQHPDNVDAVYDDYEGFRILLRGYGPTTPMLRLRFDWRPLYYQVTEEGSWLMPEIPDELIERLRTGERFFVFEDSELLSRFKKVAGGARDWPELRHFCVVMSESIVEVIAAQPPSADILNGPDQS